MPETYVPLVWVGELDLWTRGAQSAGVDEVTITAVKEYANELNGFVREQWNQLAVLPNGYLTMPVWGTDLKVTLHPVRNVDGEIRMFVADPWPPVSVYKALFN